VAQVEGQFDLTAAERQENHLIAQLPIEDRSWQIGLLVGPSGSGKSTLLRQLWGEAKAPRWDPHASVLDSFPRSMTIQEVTGVLSSVGFSSPPAWLRPFHTLSNGEQFRVSLARLLCSMDRPIVVDEFTSVVDRTVAKVGAAAVATHVRRGDPDRQLVVASCHEDVTDWLQPDWVYETGGGSFSWRHLQRRPQIRLTVYRSTAEAWRWFAHHHYLSDRLSPSAFVLVGCVEGQPAALSAAVPQIGHVGIRRESRVVVLPDFQGVGLGNRLSELHGGLWRAAGYRFRAVASHPAVVAHRARSPLWRMDRAPSVKPRHQGRALIGSERRLTASFEYIGPRLSLTEAAAFGLQRNSDRDSPDAAPSHARDRRIKRHRVLEDPVPAVLYGPP
jgi:ABC-type transport system involved in cytochrome c biogenesis ATPase subunit